jgi:D-arabinose 1-dehydrogenase-like Zn-dependent alcohol dehydrogenase
MPDTSRRNLLRLASLAGLAPAALAQTSAQTPRRAAGATSVYGMKFDARPKVRMGIVGVGGRGSSLLQTFAAVDNVEIVALCDVFEDKCARGKAALAKAGQTAPVEIYAGNDHSFEALAKRDDLDLIIVATP